MSPTKLSAPELRRLVEVDTGLRYPGCECDLSLPQSDRCTRVVARCHRRVARFLEPRADRRARKAVVA